MATRGSPLARLQTELVARMLEAADPGVRVEPLVVTTRGDELADVALERIGGQGVFVTEVQAAVVDGRADLAVHSAKDLPPVVLDGLTVGAVPPRGDPRDALVGCRLGELAPGAVVATGSARRRAQLANLRPDLTFVELRGNMARRLARAGDHGVSAVVAAAAALIRLGLEDQMTEVLAPRDVLPQVGQGALAVECRADDDALRGRLDAVDDAPSHFTLDAERALLAGLGANCQVPVAGWAEPLASGEVRLHGMMASGDGRVLVRAHVDAAAGSDPDALGAEVARMLLEDCGGSALDDWSAPG